MISCFFKTGMIVESIVDQLSMSWQLVSGDSLSDASSDTNACTRRTTGTRYVHFSRKSSVRVVLLSEDMWSREDTVMDSFCLQSLGSRVHQYRYFQL